MTQTPDDAGLREPRSEQALVAAEREQLEAFLDDNRDELLEAVAGLTDEQAHRRLVPSLTTPIALLKHAAAAERSWFQKSLAGRDPADIDGLADGSDVSFAVRADETLAEVVAEYQRAAETSRRIAAAYALDDLAPANRRGPLTLRWIYVHMIEELARHAGHADILREQILVDEATGPSGGTRTRTVTWDDPMETAAGMAGRTGLEFLQALAAGELPPPPIMATIGADVAEVAEGRVVFTLIPAEFHYNPIGSVHGGVYATLLDSACGCAVQSMLPAGVGYTSLDLSIKFLRPLRADSGPVRCVGTVRHLGRRTALAQADLLSVDDKLLATATSSCVILSP